VVLLDVVPRKQTALGEKFGLYLCSKFGFFGIERQSNAQEFVHKAVFHGRPGNQDFVLNEPLKVRGFYDLHALCR
jgi:hypothetical protein